jgi:hypothetical protein
MIGRSSVPYGKAGLLGFLAATLLFIALPHPETSSLNREITFLIALQGRGMAIPDRPNTRAAPSLSIRPEPACGSRISRRRMTMQFMD